MPNVRLSWPPIAAVVCFVAAVLLAMLRPEMALVVLALTGGSVSFSILSIRDAFTRDVEP